MSELYVEKYRPRTLDDLIIQEDTRSMIAKWLEQGTISNLMLSGHAGIGKTSLAKLIANHLSENYDADVLYIPCSVDSSVEMVRTKVLDFCQMESIGGIKVVILDEFDMCKSGEGGAQMALRNPIEDASDDTRFILTCNYIHKVIAPIRSRCLEVEVNYSEEDIVKRVVEILKKEDIQFEIPVLKQFIEKVIKTSFPDIRNMIKTLEAWCITGVLKPITLDNTSEWHDMVKYIMDNIGDPLKVRKYAIKNEGSFNRNYQRMLGLLFNEYADQGNVEAMVTIADSLRNCGLVLDHEIEFTSCIIALNNLAKMR